VRREFPRAVELAGAGAVILAALLVWALAPTYPNYDSYYHLVWGRELLDGLTPTFEAYAAPTKHPLFVAVGAGLGVVFGEDADRALVALCLLCHALLVLGAYRLGAAVFGRWSGVLGALFVASSASFLLYAARAYVDMPFLALVVWAAVLAVRGSSRAIPMTLLVLAGLLRPEAWVLAGLYWLGTVRDAPSGRERVLLTLAVGAAPVLWALVDLVSTGDPLHSLNATSELADDLGREQGLQAVPEAFVSFVGATVRPPVFLLALVGGVIAVRALGVRAVAVPLALGVAGVVTFVGTGVLGLSILPRYLTVPSVAACLFAGYALAGFTTLASRSPVRRRWARAAGATVALGALATGVLLLVAPGLGRAVVPSPARVSEELRFIRATHVGLVGVLAQPAVRAGRRCGPLTLPNYRLVPDARWLLDAPRSAVTARSARRRDGGAALFLTSRKGLRRYGFADGASPTTNVPDPGFQPVGRSRGFSAYVRCGLRRDPAPAAARATAR
jgi:hypothetical protein